MFKDNSPELDSLLTQVGHGETSRGEGGRASEKRWSVSRGHKGVGGRELIWGKEEERATERRERPLLAILEANSRPSVEHKLGISEDQIDIPWISPV